MGNSSSTKSLTSSVLEAVTPEQFAQIAIIMKKKANVRSLFSGRYAEELKVRRADWNQLVDSNNTQERKLDGDFIRDCIIYSERRLEGVYGLYVPVTLSHLFEAAKNWEDSHPGIPLYEYLESLHYPSDVENFPEGSDSEEEMELERISKKIGKIALRSNKK